METKRNYQQEYRQRQNLLKTYKTLDPTAIWIKKAWRRFKKAIVRYRLTNGSMHLRIEKFYHNSANNQLTLIIPTTQYKSIDPDLFPSHARIYFKKKWK